MTFPFEFHDSEVRVVEVGDATLRIHFSAAHVLRDGTTHGFLKPVELALEQASWLEPAPQGAGRLAGGRVSVEGRAPGPLAIPFEAGPDVVLTLRFADGRQLEARGVRLTISAPPDARFVEDLSC